jgi:hypothetical protein
MSTMFDKSRQLNYFKKQTRDSTHEIVVARTLFGVCGGRRKQQWRSSGRLMIFWKWDRRRSFHLICAIFDSCGRGRRKEVIASSQNHFQKYRQIGAAQHPAHGPVQSTIFRKAQKKKQRTTLPCILYFWTKRRCV